MGKNTDPAARDAISIWERIVSLTYLTASLSMEEEVAGRIISSLREASSTASIWASRTPPSPTIRYVLSRLRGWVEEASGRLKEALEAGRASEARQYAELLSATLRNTHTILLEEASRYRIGFQAPVIIAALTVSVAALLSTSSSLLGMLASTLGFVFLASGAAASSLSPRLSLASIIIGGCIILAAFPPLSIMSIDGAGVLAALLAYLGLSSRRVSIMLPQLEALGKRAEVEAISMSEDELFSKLREKYVKLYGDHWRTMLEYDISTLTRTGLSRKEAMMRRLRELGG